MSSKQEAREERKRLRLQQIQKDLQTAVLDWAGKKHKFLSEPVGGALAAFHPRISSKTAGKRIHATIQGEVLEPLKPIKLKPGVKLVLKDREKNYEDFVKSYKESGKIKKLKLVKSPDGYIYSSASSAKMAKALKELKIVFNADGRLYSTVPFNKDWAWQMKAIWLRLGGVAPALISRRLGIKYNTVKGMFKRLEIVKFFPREHKLDFATIGYGAEHSKSGWRAVLHGGSSDVLYPEETGVINPRIGNYDCKYRAYLNMGESVSLKRDGLLEKDSFIEDKPLENIKPFDLKKHSSEVKMRNIEDKEYRNLMQSEQKIREIESLERNLALGFNSEKGVYEK